VFRRKIPTSSLVFLSLSVVAGLSALLVMQGYAHRIEAARPDVGRPVKVVVAVAGITRGSIVTPDMVRDDQIPSMFVPPGAVPAVDDVVGRVVSADLAAGDVLTRTRLAGTQAGPVAALVPSGLRAFLIPSSLPPDAVRAGDRVDVLAAFEGGRPHVETVADGVEVSQVMAPSAGGGVGGVAGVDATTGPSLVLLVDPDTAASLAYAVTFAKLAVAIEPPRGNDIFTTSGEGSG
jgi:Flp pilus assembly protein CpaB